MRARASSPDPRRDVARSRRGPDPGHDPSGLLRLQAKAGNAAVGHLLALQRCGDHVEPGCACAEDTGVRVSRFGGGPPPPVCLPAGSRRVTGSDAGSVDQAVAAGCLPEAYAILNGHAMSGLLPLLSALRTRATFAAIRSSAAGMGGPRMVAAVAAVDVMSAGGPITGAALRGLVDHLAPLPPDQRRDVLRFVGALVVIPVQGIDIDFSYCRGATGGGCTAEIKDAIKWSRMMQAEYAACRGKRGVTDAVAVEACVDASLARKGIGTSVAGSTSSTGVITIAPTTMSKCQPILDRGTEIHEAVHDRTRVRLAAKHGAGTPAFDAAWEAADKWISDDIAAYGAEIPFYRAVLKAIATLEGKLR